MIEVIEREFFNSTTPSRYSLRKLPRIDYAARLSSGLFPKSISEKEEAIISEKGPPPTTTTPMKSVSFDHHERKKSSQLERREEEEEEATIPDDATTWTTQVLSTHSLPSSPQSSFISRTHSFSTKSSYPTRDSTPDLLKHRSSRMAIGKQTPSSRIRQWVNLLSPKVWKKESMIVNDEGNFLNSSSPVRPSLIRYRRTPSEGSVI